MSQIFTEKFFTSTYLFWNPRVQYSNVSNSTIALTSDIPTKTKRFKNYFSFTQNKQLLEVNRKLSSLNAEILNQQGPSYTQFKEEIHKHGIKGFYILQLNLIDLNNCFEKGNQRSLFSKMILRIVNVVRKIFGYSQISLQRYEVFDICKMMKLMKKTALALTEDDKKRALFSVEVNGCENPNLSNDNLQRLELGLRRKIVIKQGSNRFAIRYLEDKKYFQLVSFRSNCCAEVQAYDNHGKQLEFEEGSKDRPVILDPDINFQISSKKSDTAPFQFKLVKKI